MGIVTGYLCLFCLGFLLLKSLTQKFHMTKADHLLAKLHRPVYVILCILCLLHICTVAPVLKTRNFMVLATGFVLVVLLSFLLLFLYLPKSPSLRKRCHKIIAAALFFCAAAHMVVYFLDYQAYQTKMATIALTEVSLSQVEDGQYIGQFDAGYIYAKVCVTVTDGSVVAIDLLAHHNERGGAAEQVLNPILAKQTFPVDAVTGATNSSKVLQQAVQNALTPENKVQ